MNPLNPWESPYLYANLHMQRDTRGRFLPLFATEFKALINIIDARGLNSGSVPVGRCYLLFPDALKPQL